MNPIFFLSCLPAGLQSRTRMRRRRSIQHPPSRWRRPLRRSRRDHDSVKKSFIPSSTSTSTSSTSATTTTSLPILSILLNIVSVIILSSILSISSTSSTPPLTRSLFANGQIVVDNSTSTCHLPLRTPPAQSTTSSNGILLSLRSSPDDPLGPAITSFGFHVDPNGFPGNNDTVRYEVYGLNYEGYYADPIRQEFQLDPLSYDYRGDFVHWTRVASGMIRREDLALDSTTVTVVEADYFQIPFGEFRSEEGGVDVTRVPPLGGVRSFYLTLVPTIAAFQYQEPGEWKLNEAIPLLADYDDDDNHQNDNTAPSILLGEGTVEYPFPDTPFLYAPKAFVGRVFYEWACPTHAPSVSSAPSGRPTRTSSEGPSGRPSASRRPSGMPSRVLSEGPSRSPSDMPTALVVPVSSGLNLALGLAECEEEDDGEEVKLSEEERRAVEGAVTVTVGLEAEEAMVVNLEAEVTGVVLACGGRRHNRERDRERRRMFESIIYSAMEGMNGTNQHYLNGTIDQNTQQPQTQQRQRRKLPTASSSLDFSVVITGEYRPLARPGDASASPPTASSSLPDLGNVAESSINRNSDTFLRELESRTPPGSSALSGVTGVIATNPAGNATSSVEGGETRVPTSSPTDVLTAMTPMEEDDSKDTILLIGIIVTGGIMILLASLLFFRHAERKAVQNRRKRMERMERRVWEERIGRGFGENVGGDGANFPSHLGPSLGPSGGGAGAGLWTETMPTSPGYGHAGPPVPNRYGVPPTTQLPPQGVHPNYNTAFSSPPPNQSFAGGHGHPHRHPSAFAVPPVYHSQQQSQLPQQNLPPQLSTSTPQNENGYSEYYAQGPTESGGSQQQAPQQYSFS